MAMPWDFVVILLLLGAVVPWRGTVQLRRLLALPRVETSERLAVYSSTIAFQWLAAGVALWRALARGTSLEQLGLAIPDGTRAALAAAAMCVLMLGHQVYSLRRLAALPKDEQGVVGELARKLMPQNAVESLAFVALSVTVALCEEVLYRGFVFAAFARVDGDSVFVPAMASALFFAVAHLYQGRRGVFATFVVGVLFAGVRSWSGSLAPCIVAHLLVDLYAGLAAPGKLGAAAAEPRTTGPAGENENAAPDAPRRD